VIATVSSEAKAAVARAAGAEAVIDYRSEDVVARVRDLTGGQGVACVIEVDVAGNGARYGDLLSFGGKAVIYGSNAAEFSLPFRPLITGFASLYFFIVYRLPEPVMRQTTAGITYLLARGDLKHPEIAVYDLDDIATAHERVEKGANAKVLVRLPG
jgi:NADPH2:quinone reductase